MSRLVGLLKIYQHKDISLEEAWSDVKPYMHHFRVFCCLAFVHILDVRRKKARCQKY